MLAKISRASAPPRYVAIANELRDRIERQKLPAHTLMPSERELCEDFQVSRMTARHALSLLESEGYVYRRPPRGTFVAEPRVTFHIGSFSDEVTRLGRLPGAQLLWAEERDATPSALAAFDLGEHLRVHAMQRLRLANGEPIAIETTYFPTVLTPGLLEEDLSGSLWELIRERYQLVPASATATIESIVIDGPSCVRLNVRTASAGILLTRTTFDADGRCIEFARDIYRADRAAFEVSASIPN